MPKRPSKHPSTSASASAIPSSSSPNSRSTRQVIEPTQLGLQSQDVAVFRQHQQVALSRASATGANRAAAQAASQGRVLVDAGSLGLLANHFDHVMGVIRSRLEVLHTQTTHSIHSQTNNTNRSIQSANAEIARMHSILGQIDDLENEFDKIRHIRDIVAGFRARVEALERRVG